MTSASLPGFTIRVFTDDSGCAFSVSMLPIISHQQQTNPSRISTK
jgi:hypothetical protein